MSAAEDICLICFDPENNHNLLQLCLRQPQAKICQDCVSHYVVSKVSCAFPGSCPPLVCPVCTGNDRCILPYTALESFIEKSVIDVYQQHARSLSSIQCSGCHCRRSLLVDSHNIALSTSNCELMLGHAKFCLWKSDISRFERGDLDVPEFFDLIISDYFLELSSTTDEKTGWEVMSDVLRMIGNPERRASLQLRYLKFRPRIWTPCCNREQCFRCRTSSYHTGRTCEEVSSSMGGDIVRCGACGVHVVKGDGCDHITCVCGSHFSFRSELAKTNSAAEFQAAYPANTAYICVAIQCGSISGSVSLARAWEEMHKEECIPHYVQWWRNVYSQCPAQSALKLDIDPAQFAGSNPAMKKAQLMWSRVHPKEMEHCRAQREVALREIAYCCCSFSSPDERSSALRSTARYFSRGVPDQLSCMLRALSHSELQEVGVLARGLGESDAVWFAKSSSYPKQLARKASQFLILFGSHPVQLRATSHFQKGYISSAKGPRSEEAAARAQSLSENFFAHFLSALTLHEGDWVSARDGGGSNIPSSALGRVIRNNEDGTYLIRWLGADVESQVEFNTQHRASLKFEHPRSLIVPAIPMSAQQLCTFSSFLQVLRMLLSEEGDSLRVEEGLVGMWEKVVGGGSEEVARDALEPLMQLLRALHDPNQLDKLCRMEELLPSEYNYRLRWVDLYYACGWAGAKARNLFAKNEVPGG